MRVFCATMIHESNCFSPIPTSLRNFQEDVLYRPSSGEGEVHLGKVLAEVDLVDLMESRGHEAIVGLIANAEPSMPLNAAAYQTLKDEILTNLKAALPVDSVFLFLHGAQMARGCPDCESDLITEVRKLIGPDVPFGVEFDLHCNIGAATMEHVDALLICLEYPHTDFRSRADQLMSILEAMTEGRCRPVSRFVPLPMLGLYHPTQQPMRGFVDRLKALEGENGVLGISLAHCFAGGDSPQTNAGVVVVTDGDEEKAHTLARSIALDFWRQRENFGASHMAMAEAIKAAIGCPHGPVVIADAADNSGGGAAGDSTVLLRALLDAGATDTALAMIWDPVAVNIAMKAGPDAVLPLRFGGKTGPDSGDPLDATVRVIAVNSDPYQHAQGSRTSLGPAVAIQTAGVKIVLNSIRQQTFSPECFTELGIDPKAEKILVVKSGQHFRQAFSSLAARIMTVGGPGTVTADFKSRRYEHLTRPIWPLDPLPFRAFGEDWR